MNYSSEVFIYKIILLFIIISCNEHKHYETTVKLPKGMQYNMSLDQLLSNKICDFKDTKLRSYKNSNATMLMCSGVPAPFKFQSQTILNNDLKVAPNNIIQVTFVKEKLRRVTFIIDGGTVNLKPLVESGKRTLGELSYGVTQEDLNKFNARVLNSLILGWEDKDQFITIHVLRDPRKNKVTTSLYMYPKDFDESNEIIKK